MNRTEPRFTFRPVEIVATTTLRQAEIGLALQAEAQLAYERFLDRLLRTLGPAAS